METPLEQMTPEEWRKDERSCLVPKGSVLALNPKTILCDLVPENLLLKYKAKELADLAYVLDVASSGTKAKKIKNIIVAMKLRERLANETVESLVEKYKGKALKQLTRLAHGFLGGNKKQLATGLINWRESRRFAGRNKIAFCRQIGAGLRAIKAGRPINRDLVREMLLPRNGGRYLSESMIEGWKIEGDLYVLPNKEICVTKEVIMDTRTGEIGLMEEIKTRIPEEFLLPVDISKLSKAVQQDLRKHGRTKINPRSRCPCGSGHRFKRCCMGKTKG